MSDLGARLKQARTTKGVSLREIATATKISVVALEGLERNDYSRLPGGIFSRAFVRAYAQAVGLDPETAVSEFNVEFERYESEAARTAKRPEITPDDLQFVERQRRALRTLRIALAAAAILTIAGVAYVVLVWWPASKAGRPAASAPRSVSTPAGSSVSTVTAPGGGPLGSHLG
ncbi:MAG TPA: helix-turn-helix transcriptional regulator [Vicinamibacterales bacterium]|nr:helix-turn-helix transcriptional regulator [Vicinamibacterales bacterium]